jgi:DNA-binding transcriptional regulator YdaS (Cro superfamily)
MHQSDQPRNKISPDKAYLIEQATKGEVKREELRPDIFGPVDYGKTIEQGVA